MVNFYFESNEQLPIPFPLRMEGTEVGEVKTCEKKGDTFYYTAIVEKKFLDQWAAMSSVPWSMSSRTKE
jgi:hypothetical protein